jgi:FKBP-type peptidyl-prolyl cis-trans isomerase SlpA
MGKITSNSIVTVNYTGKLEDGSIFDSSLNEGRDPLTTTLGQSQLIKGFEDGLIDMEVGDKKTVEIESDMAYGQYNEAMIQEVPKEKVPEGVMVGHMLQANTPMGPINFRVMEVNEESVKLDGNHPLAGKKLIFDLEVLEVK